MYVRCVYAFVRVACMCASLCACARARACVGACACAFTRVQAIGRLSV